MTVQEHLRAAADYMAEYGKIKGTYYNATTGSVCMVGAVVMVQAQREGLKPPGNQRRRGFTR